MTPLRGWAPRGLRLQTKAPHGHWKTTTFLAALRHDRIDAPWLFDGPIDGESFRTYVEKVLVPTLHPGDIVVMDNLGSHKAKAVRQLIRAAGGPEDMGSPHDDSLTAQGDSLTAQGLIVPPPQAPVPETSADSREAIRGLLKETQGQ